MQVYPKKMLDLKTENNQQIFYNPDRIKYACEKTETFLDGIDFINSIDFTKKVLFPYEVKFNNAIEGYTDDISHIMELIKFPNNEELRSQENYHHLKNLIIGYEYILKKKVIDKDNLKKLYDILSANLLDPQDVISNPSYYRDNDVYIFFSSRIDTPPDKGVAPQMVEICMQNLLDYINSNITTNSPIDAYIKSQIIHYYLVYVHPYYDINGRTARTLSLWYLINNEAYPFTIFNRSISHTKKRYYRVIRDVKKFNNLTFFLTYMLENIQREIEKECIINSINNSINQNLSVLERQTLQYILENKVPTILDLSSLYNRFNKVKRSQEIYETMIVPLIDKGIIKVGRPTNKTMFDDVPNRYYELNTKLVDDSNGKIKIFEYAKR